MKKLDYIDGMKGLGAWMVYLCHFVYAFYYGAYSLNPDHAHTESGLELAIGKTPFNFFYNGNAAVCMFLVFSGFVLCLSYFRTRDKERLKKAARRRYIRLMPMILYVNVLVFLLMSFGLYRDKEAAVLTGSEAWLGGFHRFAPEFPGMLFESLIGCFLQGSNAYNGVLWTIPYLFSGALVVYLAAYLVGENPLRYAAYGAMLLVSLKTDVYFAAIFLGFVLCDFYSTQKWLVNLYERIPPVPALVFVLGFYLSSYPSFGEALPGTIYRFLPPSYAVIYHIAGAFFLTAGVLGCKTLQRFFSGKVFRYLGKISFSLYLLHFPVIASFSCWFFLEFSKRLGYHLTAGLDFLLTTALVLAVSTLSWKYLEPSGQRLEDLAAGIRKKKQKNGGAA